MVGVEGLRQEAGLLSLRLLERARQDPSRPGWFLEERIVRAAQPPPDDPEESNVRELQRIITTATIVLAPAENFRRTAEALVRKGVRATERGLPEFRLWRLGGRAGI